MVPDHLVEGARQLGADVGEAAYSDDFETQMGPLARRLGNWLDGLRAALA